MEKEKFFDRFVVPLFICSLFIFGLSFLTEPKVKDVTAESSLTVSFLNVGQGDAIALRKNNRLYLIDGGPDKSILSELPKTHPPLSKKIDYIFVTHPHADHLSGINYLFERYRIERLFTNGIEHYAPDYKTFKEQLKKKNIPEEVSYAGKKYLSEELSIEVLWPGKGQKLKNINDTSLVLLMTFNNRRFLFLGDLSATKQDIISDIYELPDIDVLKVAHHGSKTGLSQKLLLETKPEIAVITVGENNYGHPAPEILTSLAGLKIYRTDTDGTIICKTDGKDLFCRN